MGEQEVVEDMEYALVVFSAIFSALAACGAFYVWPWSQCSRTRRSLTEYNSVWGVRICLQLTAALWMLSPILQLHESWTTKVDELEKWDVRGSLLCQMFLSVRVGLYEPFFLFLGLLALKHSLQQGQGWEVVLASEFDHKPTPIKNVNSSIIGRSFLNTFPILVVQAILAIVTSAFLEDMASTSSLRTLFLASHVMEIKGCPGIGLDGSKPSSGCFVCIYPLVSTLVSAIFVLYYVCRLWVMTSEMIRITLNQSLTQRMRFFRTTVSIVLTLGLLCRGLTLAVAPRSLSFELLRLGDFLSAMVIVITVSYSMVLRPVHDLRFAEKVDSSDAKFWKKVDRVDILTSEREP